MTMQLEVRDSDFISVPFETTKVKNSPSAVVIPSPRQLNILHFLNDGFQASLLWMLPLAAVASGISSQQIGLMASVHLLLGVLLGIPAGMAGKRWGGQFILVVAMLVYGLAFVLAGLGSAEWILWLVMLFAGLGFGAFHPIAFGLVARNCHATAGGANAGREMGRFAAVGDVGRVVLSWSFVAVAAAVGLNASAALAGTVAVGFAIWQLTSFQKRFGFKSRQSSLAENESTTAPTENRFAAFTELVRNRSFRVATLIGACDGLVTTGLILFVPLVLVGKGYDGFQLSVFVALLYGGSLAGKVAIGGLADRIGSHVSMAICQLLLILTTTGLVSLDWAGTDAILTFALGVLSKGCLPIVLSLTANSLKKHQLDIGFGVNQMVTGAAAAASPALAGWIAGYSSTGWACVALCVFSVVAIGLAIRSSRLIVAAAQQPGLEEKIDEL